MPSPMTITLRSGTLSRFSGSGALEKSWYTRFGCCCWNGEKKSPKKPPPLLRGAAGRCPKPPKLKNCAEAGATMPTNSAIATQSTASGPGSVRILGNDGGLIMQLGRNFENGNRIIAESGRKRADYLP